MITEADTCRKYVLLKLYATGWNDDQISEQKTFTDGRIVVVGENCYRKKQKRADYLLKFRRDFNIAVIEAKPAYKSSGDGLQQAKEYAEILVLKFAYSTNGKEIVEHDFIMGKDTHLEDFPSPDELWVRFSRSESTIPEVTERLLTPCNTLSGKTLRYYQEIAKDERRPGLYKQYTRDFLDLIIIDECHRESAKDESNWREILEYFEPAYQISMTATPSERIIETPIDISGIQFISIA